MQWLHRANEIRACAEQQADRKVKQVMLEIAEELEILAKRHNERKSLPQSN
jgi:hypothetical protein